MRKPIQKAGALILRDSDQKPEILLIYREKNNDWSFPKGHIEENETPENAAIREVREETGISIELIRQLPLHAYCNHANHPVELMMFLAKYTSVALTNEHNGNELRWVPVDEVVKLLTHKNLKEYFSSIRNSLN